MGEDDTSPVLVTGSARGIGAAVARMVHDAGPSVIIADILDEEGRKLAKELGERAHYVHLDVTSASDWADAVAVAEGAAGPLASLVNNAGILDFGPIETHSEEGFRRILDVNLLGTWLGMRAALPSLRRSGGGSIVNLSSTAGMQGYAGIGAYVASKWAIRGLTKTAALEFAADGVRVCSVHPGPIRTPMTAEMEDAVVASQPIPRFGSPEEVARMVGFLVMEATYSTGSEFVVDGGAIAGAVLPLDTT
ncbi:SDR family oxidoreductase [Lipingzhangella sp. LS1_29]|uniref:SDR family oxidoreductase n=1 Tax=Lipingzhangella rawalii TaxID=2055835 RepID=A0ABU2HAR7_9ACTN|nr:SDR family oxidoreductase [Lipingzhangella rawalii]MDS1272368.1 SDR family oxidoreductase [Lipingzhangella rawalii]